MFQIMKVDSIALGISEKDTMLAEVKNLVELDSTLKELGYDDAKTKLVNGMKMYYKGKTNVVYIKYSHSKDEKKAEKEREKGEWK